MGLFSPRRSHVQREAELVDAILETRALTKSFGSHVAVAAVDLSVRRHSIHALIGPNGAGKTTFFNLLTKFYSPTSGQILFNGNDITAVTAAKVARTGIVRSFQISAIFPSLTVLENVRIALQRKRGESYDFWRSKSALLPLNEHAYALLDDVGLADFADLKAAHLAYGRKRALEIAATIALDPELLLLDEPTAGMGYEEIDRIVELIRTIARDRTLVIVEHNLPIVASLADRITVLARGRVLADGDYAHISTHPEVKRAYLGGQDE